MLNNGVFRKIVGIQFQYFYIAKNFLQMVNKSLLWISGPIRMVKLEQCTFDFSGCFNWRRGF